MPNSIMNSRIETKAISTVVAPRRRACRTWGLRIISALRDSGSWVSGGPARQGRIESKRVVHHHLPVDLNGQLVGCEQAQVGPAHVGIRQRHADLEALVLEALERG